MSRQRVSKARLFKLGLVVLAVIAAVKFHIPPNVWEYVVGQIGP